jgi:hypothetical protein
MVSQAEESTTNQRQHAVYNRLPVIPFIQAVLNPKP